MMATTEIMKATCDLCAVSVTRIPKSLDQAKIYLAEIGWVNLTVMGDEMDICPICQVVARSVQLSPVLRRLDPSAYPKAYEDPTA
jgi:hypothetical protein